MINAATKILWDFNNLKETLEKSDAIFALGSMDLKVPVYAASLIKKDLAPILICSGGVGRLTPKEWKGSEAEKFAEVALHEGLDSDQVIVESKSKDTVQNIDFSLAILKEKGIKVKQIILVTQPSMARRANEVVRKRYPEVKILSSAPQISLENYPDQYMSFDFIVNVLVGEIHRLIEYPKRGFINKVEIPKEVLKAYEELSKAGFNKFLVS